MTQQQLREYLEKFVETLDQQDKDFLDARLESLVSVFLGVWVDTIRYWVLSHDDVKDSPYLSHQHRGGVEYQIGMTDKNIQAFDQYLVRPSGVADRVIAIGKQSSG